MDVRQLLVRLWVAAIDQRLFADGLYQLGATGFAQCGDCGGTFFPIFRTNLDLDQFVIGQSAFEFGDNALSQPLPATIRTGFRSWPMDLYCFFCSLLSGII